VIDVSPFDEPTGRRALRTSTAKLVDLWRARELLLQLVRKELKVRYKNSTLGFLWSMITPVLMTIVFSVVFTLVVRIPVADFPAFFIAGYLLWQFFQNSCQGAIHSIVGNGDLVKKVYFPREVLPLSHVLAQLIHLLLALLVISPYLIYTRGWGVLTHLPATLLAVVLLTVFASGAAMWFAGRQRRVPRPAGAVRRHLPGLVLHHPGALPARAGAGVADARRHDLEWIPTVLLFNPMTWFVEIFREPLYGPVISDGAGQVVSLPPGWTSLSSLGIARVGRRRRRLRLRRVPAPCPHLRQGGVRWRGVPSDSSPGWRSTPPCPPSRSTA
jgi:ABC-type polysaccharide/polyol phosphate export permease